MQLNGDSFLRIVNKQWNFWTELAENAKLMPWSVNLCYISRRLFDLIWNLTGQHRTNPDVVLSNVYFDCGFLKILAAWNMFQ